MGQVLLPAAAAGAELVAANLLPAVAAAALYAAKFTCNEARHHGGQCEQCTNCQHW